MWIWCDRFYAVVEARGGRGRERLQKSDHKIMVTAMMMVG
jgi:hypothetical protein